MRNSRHRVKDGFKWFGKKVAEKLFDDVWSMVGVVSVAAPAAALAWGGFLALLRDSYKVPGWIVAAGLSVLTTTATITVVLAIRAKRSARAHVKKFTPIPVEDEALHLRWLILAPISQWIESNALDTASESYSRTLLDGPFHSKAGCIERLAADHVLRHDSPTLRPECPGCSDIVFNEAADADLWTVRRQAIAELQRLHRAGKPIALPRVVLERPLYWKRMTPVRDGNEL